MKCRVWWDSKHHSEALDGMEFESSGPYFAAREYAARKYTSLGHCDPEVCFVRDLETREVTRWYVSPRVSLDVEEDRDWRPTSQYDGYTGPTAEDLT